MSFHCSTAPRSRCPAHESGCCCGQAKVQAAEAQAAAAALVGPSLIITPDDADADAVANEE
jgi:hypothetical protein